MHVCPGVQHPRDGALSRVPFSRQPDLLPVSLPRQGRPASPEERQLATAEAAALAADVRFARGVHGIWNVWERPFTTSGTASEAAEGLKTAMAATADRLGDALQRAEGVFRETLWSERVPLVDATLALLREGFAPHFPDMARRQSAALELDWPPEIDGFLVSDSYGGSYSHPLTIGVAECGSQAQRLELFETVLHEATHVASVYTVKEGLSGRLGTYLAGRGLRGDQVWNVEHAMMFASSAQQVRTCIDSTHVDYALVHRSPEHNLYSWFKVPNLPALWANFTSGTTSEPAFLAAVAQEVAAHPG